MKSSSALQVVGGIVGLGMAGVITTLLLTQDERETNDTQSGKGHGPHGGHLHLDGPVIRPIHLPVTLFPQDPFGNPTATFPAGQVLTLYVIAPKLPGDTGNIMLNVNVAPLDMAPIPPNPMPTPIPVPPTPTPDPPVPVPVPPVPPMPPPTTVDVPLGIPAPLALTLPDNGTEQFFTVMVWLDDAPTGHSYKGELLINIRPPAPGTYSRKEGI